VVSEHPSSKNLERFLLGDLDSEPVREELALQQRRMAEPVVRRIAAAVQGPQLVNSRDLRLLEGIPQVDLWIERSRALRFSDPEGMVEAARKACAVADSLSPRVHGTGLVHEVRALAWAELANAYRAANDLAEADAALACAADHLTHGCRDLRTGARIAEVTASLQCGHRDFQSAYVLIDHASRLYSEIGDTHLQGRCLVNKSFYAACQGEPLHAIYWLSEGMKLIDLKRDPELSGIALQNLILYTVDAGGFEQAQKYLFEARYEDALPGGAVNEAKLRDTEGRIFAGLGQLKLAEQAFKDARKRFEELGLGIAAGIAGLDLGVVWLRQGRLEMIPGLAQQLLDRFRLLRVEREALASVILFCKACREERLTVEMAQGIVHELRRQARRAGCRPGPRNRRPRPRGGTPRSREGSRTGAGGMPSPLGGRSVRAGGVPRRVGGSPRCRHMRCSGHEGEP
jgi:tetratricopeptide (TPR) repeat protein